jgi:NAD(P)-dependent dehydrogenase (short-subunit alcohol dehydrogenase family)
MTVTRFWLDLRRLREMMMFMSVIDNSLASARYGELAGARVMITGLSPAHGVDIARAFADHKARLVLQTGVATDPETTSLIALLAETAHEIKLFDTPLATAAAANAFAQTGCQTFGSIDAVINLIPVLSNDLAGLASMEDIEAFVAEKLAAAAVITRVTANRMRTMMSEGLILNVIVVPERLSKSSTMVLGILRAALATLTRREAETWAGNGIRINAIGPAASLPGDQRTATLASEPEMAAVALYLASKRARGLSGHVFDAEGSLTKCG